jgi:hypothetical protein
MVNAPFEERRPRKPDKPKLQNRDVSMQSKFNIKPDKRHFGRNFHKNEAMAAAEPHTSGVQGTEASTMIDTSTAPPIVAIVAPTTRPPPNTSNSSSHATCKAGAPLQATIIPQAQQQQPTLMHTTAYRIQGVPHHHFNGPIQLTTTLSPPPTMQQASTSGVQIAGQPGTVWPIVEPIFHFGPGFELHQTYCPTHSQSAPSEHVVLFHLLPGVAVSFQIGGSRKIIRGESIFSIYFLFTNDKYD